MEAPKSDAEKLQAYLGTIPMGEYKEKLKDLYTGCQVNKYMFDNWRARKCKIAPLYKTKIEEIAGRKIF